MQYFCEMCSVRKGEYEVCSVQCEVFVAKCTVGGKGNMKCTVYSACCKVCSGGKRVM